MELSRMLESMTAFPLTQWVIFFPLLGILINLIAGRRLGEKFSGTVGCLASGLAFVVSGLLAVSLASDPVTHHIEIARWFSVGTLEISWALRVDTLSVTMMLVVSGVGTLIHIYSIGYMSRDVRHNNDPARFTRFFIYLNLFIAAMMLLVSADNYLVMFVGWEGVGLCSYLLIGFWYEKGLDGIGNAIAGKKAFITNRIGDFGVLIALFILFGAFGSLDFDRIFEQAPALAGLMPGVLIAVTLFLLLGVTGKSAQLPLYVWLPDAMAGPTPVSALIHAATMVTAGVYLIARSAPLFSLVPAAQNIVAWLGALTAIFAATIALGQYDIKRVLAYSTISQLGYMVSAVGMGAYAAGMFHLVTHAFFKALLFLAAGSVIQGLERGEKTLSVGRHQIEDQPDPQDMRNMGGLRKRMPLTFSVFLIGAFALSGIAPLSGFFSKDEILAEAYHSYEGIFILLIIAAFLTALYMGRQVFLVFFKLPRSKPAAQATESRAIVTIPLVILAFLSLTGGLLNLPLSGHVLPGGHLLTYWLSKSVAGIVTGEFNGTIALLSTGLVLLAILLAWLFYGRQTTRKGAGDPMRKVLGPVFTGFERRWWVDEIYQVILLKPFQILSDCLAHPFDQGTIDGSVNGIATGTRNLSNMIRKLQNGYVRNYALAVIAGFVLILAYLLIQ
jgi:NADH-quinone oxidoreductase subunit L